MEGRERAVSEGREVEREAVATGEERIEEDEAELIQNRDFGQVGYDQREYDKREYDRREYDQRGYDDSGWGRDGYNRDGYHRDDYGRHL